MVAGFLFFFVTYRNNDGILRWYAFAGCAVGILFYLKTCGTLLEYVRKWLLQKKRKAFKIKYNRKKVKGRVPENEQRDSKQANRKKKEKQL